MKSLWNDEEAARFPGDLGQRVYSSRLLGRDRSLVLHGGGNTSVKIRERNLLGDEEEILYVKGSGWDLETIEAGGFAPVRMAHLLRLAQLESLTDPQMVNEMMTHLTRHGAPAPSVEAILHACLPYRYVDHTHADALIALSNTDGGEARVREVYGGRGGGDSLRDAGLRSGPAVRARSSRPRRGHAPSGWCCSTTGSSRSERPRASPTSA